MQIIRRSFLAAGLLGLAAGVLGFAPAAPARAGELAPYSTEAFSTAQKAGGPVLVFIHADWCPTCARQAPIVSSLISRPRFGKLVVLEVDFDKQKDVVRGFGARSQSTLIAFKGAKEVGRSVGETDARAIEALAEKAL